MPDCDKIEREIRKPWRKPYRLACGNAPLPDQDLFDELIKAVGQDIKTDFDCPVTQLCDAIFDAVVEQPPLPFGSPSDGSLQSRDHFLKKLEEIKSSSGNSVGVKQGARASERVCDELRSLTKPYDGSQVGISNTRAVNPIALIRMTQFIKTLTGQCFQVRNPFLFQTKGEMCKCDAFRQLGESISTTFSCDGFPMRIHDGPGITQCGSCTSCLLRRVSLEAAGLTEFDRSGMYLRDLMCPSFEGKAKTLRAFKAMDWQSYRIKKCLEEGSPWQALTQEFPELLDVVTEMCCNDECVSSELEQGLIRLYLQYVTEWEGFSALTLLSRQALVA